MKLAIRAKWLGYLSLMTGWLFAPPVLAQSSNISRLYQSFLDDPNKAIFVSFEREVLVPKHRDENRSVKLADGRTIELHFYGKDYFAFLTSGKKFLAAYSGKTAITNLAEVMLAERLAGYDGNEYWALDLGKAMEAHIKDSSISTNKAAVSGSNRLTVIEGSELQRDGKNPTLQAIQGLAIEGYTVAHLGCSYALAAAPAPDGEAKLRILDPVSQPFAADLSFARGGGTPSAIKYHTSPRDLNVALDEARDAVGVIISYQEKPVRSTSYQVLAVADASREDAASVFSWHTYARSNAKVISFLVANGVTSKAEIHEDKLIPIQKLYNIQPAGLMAANVANGGARKFVLLILFALSAVGAALIARTLVKQKQQGTNT